MYTADIELIVVVVVVVGTTDINFFFNCDVVHTNCVYKYCAHFSRFSVGCWGFVFENVGPFFLGFVDVIKHNLKFLYFQLNISNKMKRFFFNNGQ